MLRKLAHFGEFALLGLELAGLFFLNRGRSFKSVCLSALCALAAASADETIQLFSGRAAMLKDVLLDFSGALTGILIAILAETPVGSTIVAIDILAFLICLAAARIQGRTSK